MVRRGTLDSVELARRWREPGLARRSSLGQTQLEPALTPLPTPHAGNGGGDSGDGAFSCLNGQRVNAIAILGGVAGTGGRGGLRRGEDKGDLGKSGTWA